MTDLHCAILTTVLTLLVPRTQHQSLSCPMAFKASIPEGPNTLSLSLCGTKQRRPTDRRTANC